MSTKFAPAERIGGDTLLELARRVRASALLPWLDAVPAGVLVLDQHRQILFVNEAFRQLTSRARSQDLLGLRPGEALDCVHARLEPGGCGCSEFCPFCGAASAILRSLGGEEDVRECRLLHMVDGAEIALDLQVYARPVFFEGERLSLVTVTDISHEKRLRYLGRTFCHDMVNLAGGMADLAEMLDCGSCEEEALAPLAQCSRRVLGEVLYHKDVLDAEAGILNPSPEVIQLRPFLERLAAHCQELAKRNGTGVRLEVACDTLVADKRILGHVLRNMLVNALEAGGAAGEVVVDCRPHGFGVRIRVENPGEMPAEIRRQLFRRYVSTKGPDRGLGAYVMRLLAEGTLGGRISVESGEGRTAFSLDI